MSKQTPTSQAKNLIAKLDSKTDILRIIAKQAFTRNVKTPEKPSEILHWLRDEADNALNESLSITKNRIYSELDSDNIAYIVEKTKYASLIYAAIADIMACGISPIKSL